MKTVSLIFGGIALCLLQCGYVSGESNNAYAKLTKVTPSIYNEYIQAVWDDESPSGFGVKFDNPLNASFFQDYVLVYMYTKDNATGERKQFFTSRVCELLDTNNDHYPVNNFLPRQLIHLIFTDWYGSCTIEAGKKPIETGGPVNTDPKNNPDLQFPESQPFELTVFILPNEELYVEKPWNVYTIKLIFDIESLPEEEGKSGYYCLNTQWNYFIVWGVCRIAEVIESTVSGVGGRVLQFF